MCPRHVAVVEICKVLMQYHLFYLEFMMVNGVLDISYICMATDTSNNCLTGNHLGQTTTIWRSHPFDRISDDADFPALSQSIVGNFYHVLTPITACLPLKGFKSLEIPAQSLIHQASWCAISTSAP
jgi:hypothetical protein